MSEEDERTLWCGNLAEKVTEELLYELFLQAGPVEMVKIPRDTDKRQRSYAFITYTHAVSVNYAIKIYDGTRLFNRQLTIHKKSRNGPNSGSPKVNNNSPQQNRGQQQQQHQGNEGNMPNIGQLSFAGMSPGAMNQMMQGMISQLSQQALAGMGQGHMQQNALQNKMNRNDRQQQQQQQHQQKPYSRDRDRGDRDRGDNHSRDRNEGQMYSRDRGNSRGKNDGGGNQRRNDYRGRR
ncbi:RNA-binding protein 7 [Ochlerotatus camptorhynchus]|uniref:RNA-binding protein 7 n=1 Tax=Ochlerotatus camptorhynchus TaxID=644619 RepID=UPI0031DDE5AE